MPLSTESMFSPRGRSFWSVNEDADVGGLDLELVLCATEYEEPSDEADSLARLDNGWLFCSTGFIEGKLPRTSCWSCKASSSGCSAMPGSVVRGRTGLSGSVELVFHGAGLCSTTADWISGTGGAPPVRRSGL